MTVDAVLPGNAVDLHTHSIVSDGMLAPAELVHAASRWGLRVLGLTDHDTVAGLELVPGVELSTDVNERDVHLLGYFVDRTNPELLAALAEFARHRRDRIERIVARLREAGAPVEMARVAELAEPGTIGRPHVARALIERGYAESIGDAFDRYLGRGRPAFVPRHRVEPERAIAVVLTAGGVPVLAHPHTAGDIEAVLARLVPAGLRGMEVYYGEYDEARRAEYLAIADRWGLIPTGGSDFHGPGFKPGRELGGPAVPLESVARLRAARG